MPARIRRGQSLEQFHAACSSASTASSSSSSASSTATSTASELSAINSAFQVQEYIALLVQSDPHDVARIVAVPDSTVANPDVFAGSKGKGKDGDGADAFGMGAGGGGSGHHVDTDVWVYEQLRRIVQDLTTPWLTTLLSVCSKKNNPDTCSAMNAGDWLYVCASHGEERQCCAIDYIVHTVDGTAALLNNPRHFPGRTYIPHASLRQFGSIARRLSRIFVHAYGHHRDVFEECEAQTSLYARFYALNALYELISTESLPALDADAARRAGLTGNDGAGPARSGTDGAEPEERHSRREMGLQLQEDG
ncbi:hypothetical protein OC834_002919 [Tilletia horrida]|uniref:Mob1/phocein n=1 Tax=Tilletia horrida TaxID=155126 RepID=A0AAN6GG52_9BASI|nr:hypothetical protein OC834_002919 [Tilletia horrida]KAK0538853.1 hypothetical protein OC842_001162 [Tilletia horrida]KAK0540780.1 hypothetical protein OC835_000487 [Tilletia horrida]KAK0560585.1 hypothetical protein OC844_003678 [Tilletia horrida]